MMAPCVSLADVHRRRLVKTHSAHTCQLADSFRGLLDSVGSLCHNRQDAHKGLWLYNEYSAFRRRTRPCAKYKLKAKADFVCRSLRNVHVTFGEERVDISLSHCYLHTNVVFYNIHSLWNLLHHQILPKRPGA